MVPARNGYSTEEARKETGYGRAGCESSSTGTCPGGATPAAAATSNSRPHPTQKRAPPKRGRPQLVQKRAGAIGSLTAIRSDDTTVSGRSLLGGGLNQRLGEGRLALRAIEVALAAARLLELRLRALQPGPRLAGVDPVARHRLADQHQRLVLAHLDKAAVGRELVPLALHVGDVQLA